MQNSWYAGPAAAGVPAGAPRIGRVACADGGLAFEVAGGLVFRGADGRRATLPLLEPCRLLALSDCGKWLVAALADEGGAPGAPAAWYLLVADLRAHAPVLLRAELGEWALGDVRLLAAQGAHAALAVRRGGHWGLLVVDLTFLGRAELVPLPPPLAPVLLLAAGDAALAVLAEDGRRSCLLRVLPPAGRAPRTLQVVYTAREVVPLSSVAARGPLLLFADGARCAVLADLGSGRAAPLAPGSGMAESPAAAQSSVNCPGSFQGAALGAGADGECWVAMCCAPRVVALFDGRDGAAPPRAVWCPASDVVALTFAGPGALFALTADQGGVWLGLPDLRPLDYAPLAWACAPGVVFRGVTRGTATLVAAVGCVVHAFECAPPAPPAPPAGLPAPEET